MTNDGLTARSSGASHGTFRASASRPAIVQVTSTARQPDARPTAFAVSIGSQPSRMNRARTTA